jgi:hypothetical protein
MRQSLSCICATEKQPRFFKQVLRDKQIENIVAWK